MAPISWFIGPQGSPLFYRGGPSEAVGTDTAALEAAMGAQRGNSKYISYHVMLHSQRVHVTV